MNWFNSWTRNTLRASPERVRYQCRTELSHVPLANER